MEMFRRGKRKSQSDGGEGAMEEGRRKWWHS